MVNKSALKHDPMPERSFDQSMLEKSRIKSDPRTRSIDPLSDSLQQFCKNDETAIVDDVGAATGLSLVRQSTLPNKYAVNRKTPNFDSEPKIEEDFNPNLEASSGLGKVNNSRTGGQKKINPKIETSSVRVDIRDDAPDDLDAGIYGMPGFQHGQAAISNTGVNNAQFSFREHNYEMDVIDDNDAGISRTSFAKDSKLTKENI